LWIAPKSLEFRIFGCCDLFEIQVLKLVIYALFARQILFHISFDDYRVQSFRLDVEKDAADKLDGAVFNRRFCFLTARERK